MNGKTAHTSLEQEQAELKKQALTLAERRQKHAEAKARLDALRADFDKEHAALIAMESRLKAAANAVESTLRIAAVNAYHAVDEKDLIPGVSIKVYKVAEFDLNAALEWSKRNMPALLVLNTKAYEKVLTVRADHKGLQEALPDMPGKVGNTPKSNITGDLSAYLPAVKENTEA